MYPSIYLPVEIGLRDLYPKILIAKKAIDHNFTIIIGDRYKIEKLSRFAYPDIFFSRSLEAPHYDKLFPFLKSKKTYIVAQDVEAGQFFDNPVLYKFIRVIKNKLKYLSAFFAWSTSEYNYLIKNYHNMNVKFYLTGNPMFELNNHYQNKNHSIKLKNYYLVNLSWPLFRPITDEQKMTGIKIFKKNGASDKQINEHYNFCLQRIEENKKLIISIIKIAKDNKNKLFIIRPHPVDDLIKFKKEIFLPDNVKIILEGNVIPWIINAKKIVHTYCSTAYQTLLNNKIPICFDGHKVEKRNLLLGKISNFTTNINELSVLLEKKDTDKDLKNKFEIMYSEFPNMKFNNSSDLIIEKIKDYKIKRSLIGKITNYCIFYLCCYYITIKSFLSNIIYDKSYKDMTNVKEIKKILSLFDNKNKIKVKKISNGIYKLYL